METFSRRRVVAKKLRGHDNKLAGQHLLQWPDGPFSNASPILPPKRPEKHHKQGQESDINQEAAGKPSGQQLARHEKSLFLVSLYPRQRRAPLATASSQRPPPPTLPSSVATKSFALKAIVLNIIILALASHINYSNSNNNNNNNHQLGSSLVVQAQQLNVARETNGQFNDDGESLQGAEVRLARRQVLAADSSESIGGDQLHLNEDFLGEDLAFEEQAAPAPFDFQANMPLITRGKLAQAIKQATQNVDQQMLTTVEPDPDSSSLLIDGIGDAMEPQPSIGSTIGPSPNWLASSMFHKQAPSDDPQVLNQTRQALISEEATRLLSRQYKLTRQQLLRGLPLISLEQTSLGKQCPRLARTYNCLPGKYRSYSGHCNNVQNPDWAAAQMPLIRYSPPRYQDHISRPMRASSLPLSATERSLGQSAAPLPSPRAVSIAIYSSSAQLNQQQHDSGSTPASTQIPDHRSPTLPSFARAHSHMTTMLSFFGQFVFHDLALVPQFSLGTQVAPIKCCAIRPAQKRHPECMPIEFKDNSKAGSAPYCLDYIRSTPAIRNGCNLGPRDQINLVSSYLDGSVIYGSSEAQMQRLRSFSGGRLRSKRIPSTSRSLIVELLPELTNDISGGIDEDLLDIGPMANNSNEATYHWMQATKECRQMARIRQQARQQSSASNEDAGNCFLAGDVRVNENIGLTLMHTIWLREHNHIAGKLSQLNKHWRDERIFDEARRIVIAELQHITYQEFLPSILGDEVMQRYNLSVQTQGYNQNYDPQLNAAISNELATSVFPFILSTIPNSLERYSDRLEMLGSTKLMDTFMDASDLFKRNKFAQYLTGMMSQSAMEPALGLMTMMMDDEAQHSLGNGRQSLQQATLNATIPLEPPLIDAVALTIQQGRDHGIKPYVHWRRVCRLRPAIRKWQDLYEVMPASTVDRLKQVYASVDQLDLYAALLESPSQGATVGPTFVCLLRRQFYKLKYGDRFWYENDLPDLSFSPKQLDEIRQTSLAKVICRNSQASINFIQPSPMLSSDSYLNAYQYCTNKAMGELDLSKWRQVINSAQQLVDEQMMNELDGLAHGPRSLTRGKRLIEENVELIVKELDRAKAKLDLVAQQESAKLRASAKLRTRRQAASTSLHQRGHGHGNYAAGYRYLPRLKRQALKLNNQSIIFELATNEVVRSLIRRGKDREQARATQNDVKDFLYSLETIQLDNLLDNSAQSNQVREFISTAGNNFLTEDQRQRLAAAGDLILSGDPIIEALAGANGAQRSGSQRSSSISTNCQDDDKAFPCDHTSPFRTITGWCNNLNNPKYGQSFTPLDRMLPNAYEDGLSVPRTFSKHSVDELGQRVPLPSARLISTTVHDDTSNLHARYSLALMQFGQFAVDHDLTRTPFSVAMDGSLLDCSPCDSKRTVHRDCYPIEIPDNDAHFHSAKAHESGLTTGPRCLHFVRSLNGQTGLGPRQQINALTAYFDGSHIYGSDNCEAKSLRAFVGGRLNASAYPAGAGQPQLGYVPREILPVTRANPECVTPSGWCFHAGDQRASEQPGLTSIHIIFMRLHNTIVNQLALINRHWSDEKLYQHGRKIVSAISQRIAYNEFVPRLLGLDYMSKFDLMLKPVGYSDDYDDSCSASILSEFAAAAFRMGHTLIRSAFPLLNRHYKPVGKPFQLRKAFFNVQRILTEPQLVDSILRGIVSVPVESFDNSISEELTNHLFEKPKEPFSGMDLVSLNIQRARDHGLQSYNNYRVKCNLTKARTFDDLAGEIPQHIIKRLANLYASVEDIDLFTGGVSENSVHGGVVGPTFACIIGTQFQRLKKCDRFWHETSDPFIRFTPAQLAEIRKMTLAKVVCSESDQIDTIQKNAMDIVDNYSNPRVPCSSLPSMDLNVWRENQKSCLVNKIRIDLGHSKRVNPCKSCTCTTEGPVCRTAKINCLQLMKQANNNNTNFLSQIMADKSCLVQCAWALDMPLAR